eukprot:PhF_6_TR25343/c0_g1_i1/m.35056
MKSNVSRKPSKPPWPWRRRRKPGRKVDWKRKSSARPLSRGSGGHTLGRRQSGSAKKPPWRNTFSALRKRRMSNLLWMTLRYRKEAEKRQMQKRKLSSHGSKVSARTTVRKYLLVVSPRRTLRMSKTCRHPHRSLCASSAVHST